MGVMITRKIVLLGKTKAGKSSLGNTIFGETVFKINHSTDLQASRCQTASTWINGRHIVLSDTPGFFDTTIPEELLKLDLLRCVKECIPGPHAFLIVLKVEKYTEQEEAVIRKIVQYFSEEAFRYAAVVFTHGDQLPKGIKIQEFVNQSQSLSDLVKKCGGWCHVVDNKYWNSNQQDPYRSNQFQVAELLHTVDKIFEDNHGGYYTNEMLQPVEGEVERQIPNEEEHIGMPSGNLSQEEVKPAKINVHRRCLIKFAGVTAGAMVGACFGVALTARLAITATMKIVNITDIYKMLVGSEGALAGESAAGTGVAVAALVGGTYGRVLRISVAVIAGTGALAGGVIGYDAAQGADTAVKAAEKAVSTVWNKGDAAAIRVKDSWSRL